jgi:hypothetical protein
MALIGGTGGTTGGGSGNVTGTAPTTDNAIVRWDGTTGTKIKNGISVEQDGGAIQTQAILINRVILEQVNINTNYTMIASNVEIETGEIVIEADAELLII